MDMTGRGIGVTLFVVGAAAALFAFEGCTSSSNSDTPASGAACTTNEAGCSCAVGTPSGTACGPTQVRDALCCAGAGWPSSGTCACAAVTCSEDSRGLECTCRQGLGGNLTACNGALCCQRAAGDCYCRRTGTPTPPTCDPADTPSAFCGATAGTHCPAGTAKVDSCSP